MEKRMDKENMRITLDIIKGNGRMIKEMVLEKSHIKIRQKNIMGDF